MATKKRVNVDAAVLTYHARVDRGRFHNSNQSVGTLLFQACSYGPFRRNHSLLTAYTTREFLDLRRDDVRPICRVMQPFFELAGLPELNKGSLTDPPHASWHRPNAPYTMIEWLISGWRNLHLEGKYILHELLQSQHAESYLTGFEDEENHNLLFKVMQIFTVQRMEIEAPSAPDYMKIIRCKGLKEPCLADIFCALCSRPKVREIIQEFVFDGLLLKEGPKPVTAQEAIAAKRKPLVWKALKGHVDLALGQVYYPCPNLEPATLLKSVGKTKSSEAGHPTKGIAGASEQANVRDNSNSGLMVGGTKNKGKGKGNKKWVKKIVKKSEDQADGEVKEQAEHQVVAPTGAAQNGTSKKPAGSKSKSNEKPKEFKLTLLQMLDFHLGQPETHYHEDTRVAS